MADLSDANAAQSVKIIGANSSDVETKPVNATSFGEIYNNLRSGGIELIGQKTMVESIPIVVASNQTPVPVQSGPQANEMFCVSADINMATSATDNRLLLLKNPSGSGKDLYIWQLLVGSTVTNVSAQFKVFANPTITSDGTAATISSRRVGSGTASIATAFTLPTISANGSELANFNIGQNTTSQPMIAQFSCIVKPNNNIMVTGNPASNNRNAAVVLMWAEITP